MSKYSERHGGPYDRGSADSYYRRPYDPHYYVEGTYNSPRIGKAQMTKEEIEAYDAGWRYNELCGDYKDWR